MSLEYTEYLSDEELSKIAPMPWSWLGNNKDKLPKKNGWAQIIAGVSHTKKEAFFFAVEYLNQDDEKCVLLGVEEIDVDTFLDYINENKYLKINE